mmetsp:Transcript_37782/g.95576  ORF Transcript_37782/g.95576 Transcript_37782/m.95576 type:complete len:265 (+) Transcript_37782:789-1583(+)
MTSCSWRKPPSPPSCTLATWRGRAAEPGTPTALPCNHGGPRAQHGPGPAAVAPRTQATDLRVHGGGGRGRLGGGGPVAVGAGGGLLAAAHLHRGGGDLHDAAARQAGRLQGPVGPRLAPLDQLLPPLLAIHQLLDVLGLRLAGGPGARLGVHAGGRLALLVRRAPVARLDHVLAELAQRAELGVAVQLDLRLTHHRVLVVRVHDGGLDGGEGGHGVGVRAAQRLGHDLVHHAKPDQLGRGDAQRLGRLRAGRARLPQDGGARLG